MHFNSITSEPSLLLAFQLGNSHRPPKRPSAVSDGERMSILLDHGAYGLNTGNGSLDASGWESLGISGFISFAQAAEEGNGHIEGLLECK